MHRVQDVVERRALVHERARCRRAAISSSVAVSSSASRTRSAPTIGSPWPGRSTSASTSAIVRSASAQSLRVALHLLRVAAVRRRPDEQVARAQDAPRRHPHPGVVVGLAAGVVQLEALTTDVEIAARPVGLVGVAVLGRPLEVDQPELAPVDDRVVARGGAVAVEPVGDGLVRDDPRCCASRGPDLLLVPLDAEAVVDVAVREHRGVQQCRRPGPQRLVHPLGEERAAGVDEHEAIVGAERAHVRERGHERAAGSDLGQLAPLAHGVLRARVDLAPPQLVRQLEHRRHLPALGAARRAARAPLAALRDIPSGTLAHAPPRQLSTSTGVPSGNTLVRLVIAALSMRMQP